MEGHFIVAFIAVIKSVSSLVISVNYVFTAEFYFTSLRATGCGFTNMMSRIGSVFMPIIIVYKFYFGSAGPFLAMGILASISTISIFIVPNVKIYQGTS